MGQASRSLVSLLLAAAVAPAFAAKNVTVEQFSQWIVAQHSKSDGKIAREVADMALCERASTANLIAWEAAAPGAQARDALIALTDASRFLAPPAADIAQKSAPDLVAQQTMLSMAVEYVSNILPKLPDFSATRETLHFEDRPPVQLFQNAPQLRTFAQGRGGSGFGGPTEKSVPGDPIHFVAKSSVVVTYRDGLEVRAAPDSSAAKEGAQDGMTTSGEFGPILSVILGDAVHSDVRWGYWEQDSSTPQAVFLYTVPQVHSNFTVALPGGQQAANLSPPYHGEIALDPAAGDILRLQLIADMQPPNQQAQIEIMVEYSSVTIGARSYMCPVKGVAISRMPVAGVLVDAKHAAPLQTRLNDITFRNYHLFRTEAKILP
jgi:hypothetical protein